MSAASLAGAIVLAAIAAAAAWHIGRRHPLLCALQALMALALWLALWPLADTRPRATLVVATANTSPMQWQRYRTQGVGVALPESAALPGAQPVPDLATALRASASGRLRVLGDGLRARDREAVGDRRVDFDPEPPRAGVQALAAPTRVVAGQPWRIEGRVLPATAKVELRDPAGALVTTREADRDGAFALVATPTAVGRVDYRLQVRDAAGRVIGVSSLPLEVVEGHRPRLWLLSGGPDPEQKFLRRWAQDAGWQVRARAALGAGLAVGDAVALDPASLSQADVLVLDARAWRGLGPAARAQLRTAVDQGLGLVLRLQDAPVAADRAVLREFGFALASGPATPVRLAGARAPYAHEEVTTLVRAPVQAGADDGVVLARDADGAPLGRWRALGRGRVAVLWAGDAYRLLLSGQAPVYDGFWAGVAGPVARAHASDGPRLREPAAWAQERAIVCRLGREARVTDPEGRAVPLVVDAQGCAAWWPARAGWHRISSDERASELPVLAEGDWPGVRAQGDREATRDLVTRSQVAALPAGTDAVPGSRWPGFLAWLLLSALAWWLERRRRGDEPQADAG